MVPGSIRINFEANSSGELYCFVLDPPLSALVNGIECATWGHGLRDKVVRHDYYGTKEVIDDLK
jgi:hypothetical protein